MGKRKLLEPLKNDWLFSCPAETPTAQVIAALNVTEQPVIGLSARGWTEDWRMANDLLRVYGYQGSYFYKPGQHVNWDSMNDWMFIKGVRGGYYRAGRVEWHFIGEVFIIRDCQPGALERLTLLVDKVRGRLLPREKHPHLLAATKMAVVLAGWAEATLEARLSGRRVAFVVNPLLQNAIML